MKMRKAISAILSVAMAASMFVAMVTTASAATVATDSKPVITATVKEVDADGYAIMQFKLTNNEELSYKLNRGKLTSNGINAIQVKLTLDETVFDVSESYISGGFTGVNVSGDATSSKTFVFAPTSVDSYMITVPEYLFQVDALLKDGYDATNIPASAITFGACKVEYTSYNNVAASDGATTYTIYGANTELAHDYTFEVGCDSTFVTAGDDDDDDDQPTVHTGYKAVADIDGLTAEFADKYEGKYFFTQKLDLAGKAATAHITILRGEEAPKTIERDLATLLGIDAEAQPEIIAGSIAVTVVTAAADVNPFTFVIE